MRYTTGALDPLWPEHPALPEMRDEEGGADEAKGDDVPLTILDPGDFTCDRGNLLGRGSFGAVYPGTWEDQTLAVKCVDGAMALGASEAELLASLQAEATLMAELKHPHTVQLYAVCLTPGQLSLLVELMQGGTLDGLLLKQVVTLSWAERLRLAKEVTVGLAYLHSQGIVHKDLKAENVLLTKISVPRSVTLGYRRPRSWGPRKCPIIISTQCSGVHLKALGMEKLAQRQMSTP
jgi:serine/threonine protein kinase